MSTHDLTARSGNRSRTLALAAFALSVLGGGWAFASLWFPWAVDGPHDGVAADQNGWQWMAYGDVLLAACVGVALTLVAVLCVAPASPRTTWLAGLSALGVLALAAAGATLVWWLTGWDFIVMDDGDLREHARGGGARRAVEGLAVTALGVIAAMQSRRGELP